MAYPYLLVTVKSNEKNSLIHQIDDFFSAMQWLRSIQLA